VTCVTLTLPLVLVSQIHFSPPLLASPTLSFLHVLEDTPRSGPTASSDI